MLRMKNRTGETVLCWRLICYDVEYSTIRRKNGAKIWMKSRPSRSMLRMNNKSREMGGGGGGGGDGEEEDRGKNKRLKCRCPRQQQLNQIKVCSS